LGLKNKGTRKRGGKFEGNIRLGKARKTKWVGEMDEREEVKMKK
jgi:hypothetical protein